MKKVLFVYSPYSGEKAILNHLDYIISKHQEAGYMIIPFRYTSHCNIDDILKSMDDSFQYIIVAGGDGTVNTVVNDVKRNGVELPIATIPAGTANDFARVLGYSNSISIACDQIISGKVVEVDIGIANENYFVNILSAGLMTDVSQNTPTYLKNTFGKLAYYVSSIQELPKFKKMQTRIICDELYYDDKSLIIFIFNGRTAGNFPIAHESNIQDGLLDVIIVKGDNFAESIQTAAHFLSGSKGKYPKGIIHFKTSSLRIEMKKNISFDVDGEQGPKTPLDVRCIPKGLKLIVPKGVKHIE